MRSSRFRTLLLAGCAGVALSPAFALAQTAPQPRATFNIPAQDLGTALTQFGQQSEREIVFSADLTRNRHARAVSGEMTATEALAMLLSDSGLGYRTASNGSIIVEASAPQSGSAAGDGADGTVQALIVTAQKREENIQDVPIAMSAFTQEDLTRSQVAGGPDLVTQVPNFTFTKTNFSGYSIQIRGIGTQAISATTDPAVAVAFNNTPFIRNRFFEQEFYDLQRVEVLRGPQGTLYGRNATGGVVNILSAKPSFHYEAKLSADIGNYSSQRLEGMVNLPLVEDKVALRLAGAWTKRDGYVTNEISGNQTDGRDLWSTRVSLRVQPTDRLNVNLIWEHFEENDDRLRSGKQLCKKDVVEEVAGFATPDYYMQLHSHGQGGFDILNTPQAVFSQGCRRESLYAKDSFQRPNGASLPYYAPLALIGLPAALTDPYVSVTNSSDAAVISATNDQPENLRVIQSVIDPKYRAHSDLVELQLGFDITDNLTLQSETGYNKDVVYSLEDFNRFNTAAGAWGPAPGDRTGLLLPGPNGGIFCDPQLGCSDRLLAVDISTAKSRQFSQEFRLASNFTGPFNFSVGANFLRYDTEDKYYVFFNSLTLAAATSFISQTTTPYVVGQTDNEDCLRNGYMPGDPAKSYPVLGCIYIDPNPIESVNDKGHNYFLSKNPYKLISYAVFGEAYYNIIDNLKITAGLRWTVDKKDAPRIPSWLLATQSVGYPVAEVIEQEWREPTGRLAVDWKPQLGFTDETLLYASYAHGYKAGGANPPGYVRIYYSEQTIADASTEESATRPTTFKPEFVNAFELGAKNTLLDGRATVNLAGFYYDYTGYQISEIVDRSAFNRNFDATVWGLEMESDWRPTENFKLGLKVGYEKTRIADGEQAIDLMDRTAGNKDWVVARPFPTYASNCILPAWLYVGRSFTTDPVLQNIGGASGGNPGPCEYAYQLGWDPVSQEPYTPFPTGGGNSLIPTPVNYAAWNPDLSHYPGWPVGVPLGTDYPGWDPSTAPNHGEGIMKPLGGNELPNAPHYTATVTGDYTLPLRNDWLMTLHSDIHWQSQSWWRVFNDNAYDKLHPYFTMNLAAIFTNEDAGWNIMAYIKNVTDETAITGAFLNSDDTGLTTNVFLTEPRLYGLRVTKSWTGASGFFGGGAGHQGPYPFTVEVGGQVQRHDAPYQPAGLSFADQFAPSLRIFDDVQNRNLDWGDGREVTVTYRPGSGPWRISAGWRSSRTNGSDAVRKSEIGGEGCALGAAFCDGAPRYILRGFNYSDVTVQTNEEHEFADFQVGREMSLGALKPTDSAVSLGLRYANLNSKTRLHIRGVPNWDFPSEYVVIKYESHDLYTADLRENREFKGLGPTVAWDASLPLLGGDDRGHLNLDWSAKGGVLFGKQKTAISGEEGAAYFHGKYYQIFAGMPGMVQQGPTIFTPAPQPRSKSATVPMLDLSLGLSYDVQRVKLSGGYRWERYFNAIDGGYAEHKSYDRTIDGPYFKIAVGFGD